MAPKQQSFPFPQTYNFIDLFSGCGGFSYGFTAQGFKCLLGVDSNEDAIKTFAYNHPQAKTFHGDIRDLTSEKLSNLINKEQVHLVIGGPPCQGFSTVGKGNVKDSRNQLFMEFVRIVTETKPLMIVFENVLGLLAKKNEPILKNIFKQFEKIGYHLEAKVLQADHFGVPQKRRRTVIIGARQNMIINFPNVLEVATLPQYKNIAEVWKNLADDKGTIHNHDLNTCKITKDIDLKRLKFIPEGKGIRYPADELKYLPKKLRFEVDWNKIREGRFRQTKLQRLSFDDVSYTILTMRGMYFHPKELRTISAREAAAIQTFPNQFVFYGTTTSQFRQIGNAVPPLLASHIAKTIMNTLNNLSKHQVKAKTQKNVKPKTKLTLAQSRAELVHSAFSYKKKQTESLSEKNK